MKKSSPLPIYVSIAVCCLCVAATVYVYWDLSQPQPVPLPPLVAEPSDINFGDISGKDIVQGTSWIKNTTKKPLRLLHVIISCSCNDVKLRQGELLPGDKTELTVIWDVRGKTGTVMASLAIVYVIDNDNQQSLQVGLKANIVPDAP